MRHLERLRVAFLRLYRFVVDGLAGRRNREALELEPTPRESLKIPGVAGGAFAPVCVTAPAPEVLDLEDEITIEHDELEAAPVELEVPVPELEAPAKRAKKAKEAPEDGPVWYFKRAILDRLDEYFFCLRRVRRWDPNGYQLASRIGLGVPADRYWIGREDVRHRWALGAESDRPAFGGVLFSAASLAPIDDDKMYPSFLYFHKLKMPPGVQAARGQIYQCVVVYDDRADYTGPCEYYVAVSPAGEIRLLKQQIEIRSEISPKRSRRGAPRNGRPFTLKTRQWTVPVFLQELAIQHDITAERWGAGAFTLAYETAIACRTGLVVRVRRDGMVGAFGIPGPRAKYFFADRDVTALAADGKRKRIFHSVREHDRVIRDDRTVTVRTHYRGIRHFAWNGYEVGIVFPDRKSLLEFPIAAEVFEDPKDVPPGMLNSRAVGKRLDQELSK